MITLGELYRFYEAFKHYATEHQQEKVSATFCTNVNEYDFEVLKAAQCLNINFYAGRNLPLGFNEEDYHSTFHQYWKNVRY